MDDLKLCAKAENELKALVNTVDIFSNDIGMKFGVSKCAMVIVHRGKVEPVESIPTSTGKITDVVTGKGYMYLGVLQTNENMQNKLKLKLMAEIKSIQ